MVTTPEQLAATLNARHRGALAEQHARAVLLRARVQEEILDAGRAGVLRRAWLIGSLAQGTFGAGSDVDVVCEGLQANDVGALYGRLVAALRIEVDILRLEDLRPAFRDRVLDEGVLLYGP